MPFNHQSQEDPSAETRFQTRSHWPNRGSENKCESEVHKESQSLDRYQEVPTMHDINVIRGKLNFLRMVKGAGDPTYIAYTKKLNMAVKGKQFV